MHDVDMGRSERDIMEGRVPSIRRGEDLAPGECASVLALSVTTAG